MSGMVAFTTIVSWDMQSMMTFFVLMPLTFHVTAISDARLPVGGVYVCCQSELSLGVLSAVGVGWWCGGAGSMLSTAGGFVGVATGWNQVVRGFVLAGGFCCLVFFRGLCGTEFGFLGLCGGCCSAGGARGSEVRSSSVSPAGVLMVVSCVNGWFLCLFGGG